MDAAFPWIVAGSALIDFLVALAAMFVVPEAAGRSRVGLIRALLALVATSVVFLAKAAVLGRLGVGLFGFVCLAYVDLVVVVPALGVALLAGRKWVARPVLVLSTLALLMAPVGIYATYWEPFNLKIETANVPVAPTRSGRSPLRVGVLTDLQTRRVTDHERKAVERLNATKPDLILIPGDVFQGDDDAFERERPALQDLLMRLSAPGGVFLVQGDVDRGIGRAERIVEGTGIILLFNESRQINIGDRRLTIGGVELEYASREARRLVDDLESAPGEEDVRILVGHRPDVVSRLHPSSRVDLVVAGHTHGGQVVLPGFGPLLTLSDVPRRVAAGGLHVMDGNRIYVSRGVGCERGQAPRIRFLCPPEVSVLTVGETP